MSHCQDLGEELDYRAEGGDRGGRRGGGGKGWRWEVGQEGEVEKRGGWTRG